VSVVVASTNELDALVRAVAGVETLYPAGSALATVLGTALQAVAPGSATAALVLVDSQPSGLRITAKVGIGAAEKAVDVCTRVHDMIAAHLDQVNSRPILQISVIVARIG
jgi:hypothetical protein